MRYNFARTDDWYTILPVDDAPLQPGVWYVDGTIHEILPLEPPQPDRWIVMPPDVADGVHLVTERS